MPVLSLRQRTIFIIPNSKLSILSSELRGRYNGPFPTLIPAEFVPNPLWVDTGHTTAVDGAALFGGFLETCPGVDDERLVAAVELAISSGYDTLPRSIFLSQLTIIDSLATRTDRPATIQSWLDDKANEAVEFKDPGLLSSMANLKQGSHGSAVSELVGRATQAMGGDETEVASRQKLAKDLYRTRSGLSHTGGGTSLNAESVEKARELATLVINAAIHCPAILEAKLRTVGEE